MQKKAQRRRKCRGITENQQRGEPIESYAERGDIRTATKKGIKQIKNIDENTEGKKTPAKLMTTE